ncbi:MAG: 50S ribosomal protein L32 [Coriobacteriia bacterium]|nr:50S ribosomal protein L32 [Coriobacteriia bacterium]MBS5478443.1 50S ribosomal protein L32 [Coriobacteriia bacterium]
MAVPKRKTGRMKTRSRYASHMRNVKTCETSVCPQCGAPKRPHCVCPNCGTYKGREVIAVD